MHNAAAAAHQVSKCAFLSRRWLVAGLLGAVSVAAGAELHVGPGRPWEDLAPALAAAMAGDVVVVHPRPRNEPYRMVALRVRQPGVVLRGAAGAGLYIPLSGEGADLSGRGEHPRAVVQFDPGADGCVLEGFELWGARNADGNAAGVRVSGARGVVIRDCVIRDNDMGVMSDGGGLPDGARGLRLESCEIRDNGSDAHAGYAHNLYLAGEEAVVLGCRIARARTGHNLKSRAHRTRVWGSLLIGAAERELDLVDAAGWTDRPGSDVWVAGCVIVKAQVTRGNRGVVHFGRDGPADRMGQLWMLYNTVITPHAAPVVTISCPKASVWMEGNLFAGGGAASGRRLLVEVPGGPAEGRVTGCDNWVDAGYGAVLPAGLRATRVGEPGRSLPWRGPVEADYRLRAPVPGITDAGAMCGELESRLGGLRLTEFVPPWGWRPRPCRGRLDLGAFEWSGER